MICLLEAPKLGKATQIPAPLAVFFCPVIHYVEKACRDKAVFRDKKQYNNLLIR
jgi:hypothetical protein